MSKFVFGYLQTKKVLVAIKLEGLQTKKVLDAIKLEGGGVKALMALILIFLFLFAASRTSFETASLKELLIINQKRVKRNFLKQ